MNKVILIGRLTKDVDLKYSSKDSSMAIARYSLAVPRIKSKEVDFINVVAFGKTAEFASKYFHKGERVAVIGRIQIDSKDGKFYTNIIVEEQEFADGKKESKPSDVMDGFEPATKDDTDLPFI